MQAVKLTGKVVTGRLGPCTRSAKNLGRSAMLGLQTAVKQFQLMGPLLLGSLQTARHLSIGMERITGPHDLGGLSPGE